MSGLTILSHIKDKIDDLRTQSTIEHFNEADQVDTCKVEKLRRKRELYQIALNAVQLAEGELS